MLISNSYGQLSRSKAPKHATTMTNILLESGESTLTTNFEGLFRGERIIIAADKAFHIKDLNIGKTVAWVIRDGVSAKIHQKLIKTTPKLFHNTKGTSSNQFAAIRQ
jgi:hypothetical protein